MFSVKAPRYLTHVLRLRDAGKAMANFFASGVFELKEKFGPLLWQLPPFFRFDAALIEDFLAALPHDTEAALAIARKRDARMHGRARLAIDAVRPLRHALEVRHASFIDARFIDLLRRYRVALVVADTGGRWPELLDVTADFVYLRLHGATELYQSRYTDAQLASWAGRVRAWAAGEEPAGGQRASESRAACRTARRVLLLRQHRQAARPRQRARNAATAGCRLVAAGRAAGWCRAPPRAGGRLTAAGGRRFAAAGARTCWNACTWRTVSASMRPTGGVITSIAWTMPSGR
jgi:uncharacterized protein YecE (DUF72 family)